MKKSLNQWLASLPGVEPGEDEGITTTIQIRCDLTLYQGQKDDGSYTGGIGIQINLPASEDQEYELSGFLERDIGGETSPTPATIADVIKAAFGIKPDDPIWEIEDLE